MPMLLGRDLIGIKWFLFGLISGALFFGCVAAAFNYKFYKPELVSWNGKLLGATQKDDLDAVTCSTEGACVVMLKDEFFRMKADFIELETQLIACQKPH